MAGKAGFRFLLRCFFLGEGDQIPSSTSAFPHVGGAWTMAGFTLLIGDRGTLDCFFPMGSFAHRLGLFHMTFLADTGPHIIVFIFSSSPQSEESGEEKYQHYRESYHLSFHRRPPMQGYSLYHCCSLCFEESGSSDAIATGPRGSSVVMVVISFSVLVSIIFKPRPASDTKTLSMAAATSVLK